MLSLGQKATHRPLNRRLRKMVEENGLQDLETEVREKFREFSDSKENEIVFRAMNKIERTFVHNMAREFDLRTSSFGREPDRRIRVIRPHFDRVVGLTDTQNLFLTDEQRKEIEKLFEEMPPQSLADELDEHQRADMKMHRVVKNGSCATPVDPTVPSASRVSPDMKAFRSRLPTADYRDSILDEIQNNKVTIITGGTGCGKTTQVPQFLLEEATRTRTKIKIFCTQPRRLPAIAVAERVAKERGERLGDTVGYHIRLEQKTSANTVLTYCTSGVLLRMLTVDDFAKEITHIILDEVHEREQNTDYLLIVLRQALKKRDDLKVILMSATMEGNRETFTSYFQKFPLAFIDIPSRLHSVQKYFLGDILALTGYKPKSMFSNFESNTFNSNDFQNSQQWIPQPQNGFNNTYYMNDHLHRSTTVPANLPAYGGSHMQHPSYYDSTFFLPQQQQSAQNYNPDSYSPYNGRPFPQTPQGYTRDAVEPYRQNQVRFFDPQNKFPSTPNQKALIEAYREAGGQQWLDSIDPDLTQEVIRYCLGSPIEGAILVFLPGYEDIVQMRDRVRSLAGQARFEPVIFTLHSQMNSSDQQKVFDPVERCQKKVILSTNIAEASLTIDDVVFVIDCGKVKEKSYDHTSRISQLKVSWIAQSNAEQRAGRAGRCRNGYCFRLYSQMDYAAMSPTQLAEMKRAAIHDVCLHAKMFAPDNMPVKRFLELAPEPPTPAAIDRSLEFLEQLGALFAVHERPQWNQGFHAIASTQRVKEPELTELGRLVAHMPLDPQLARLLLFGLALKCLHPVLGLVAALSHRDPCKIVARLRIDLFPVILPVGEERNEALLARDRFCNTDFSDHLMLIRALNAYCQQTQRNVVQFCRSNFLGHTAMKMIAGIRKQLFFEMRRLHLVHPECLSSEDPELNRYSSSWPVIQGAIAAGCYPGVAFVRSGTKLRKIRTSNQNMASLHPSSSLRRQVQQTKRADPSIEYLVYQELAKLDEGLTLRTVTAVPPLTVALLAGPVRMSRVIADDFELAEEDYEEKDINSLFRDPDPNATDLINHDVDNPNNQGFGFNEDVDIIPREYYVELEQWLGFKGMFKDLQLMLRLRFKFMTYFLHMLKNPLAPLSPESEKILETVAFVLEKDHKKANFQDCVDIYVQKYVAPKRAARGETEDKNTVNVSQQKHSVESKKPVDAAPLDSSIAGESSECQMSRATSKSQILLAQLHQAQRSGRERDERHGKEDRFYRPPKSYRNGKDDKKDVGVDKLKSSGPEADTLTTKTNKNSDIKIRQYSIESKESKSTAESSGETNVEDTSADKACRRRIRKKVVQNGKSKSDEAITSEGVGANDVTGENPSTSSTIKNNSSMSNGSAKRVNDFFKKFGLKNFVQDSPRNSRILSQVEEIKSAVQEAENVRIEEKIQDKEDSKKSHVERRRHTNKYVIPANRQKSDDEKLDDGKSGSDCKRTVGIRPTVAQHLERSMSQRMNNDQPRLQATHRVFRSKNYAKPSASTAVQKAKE